VTLYLAGFWTVGHDLDTVRSANVDADSARVDVSNA
jgi:hypothetical protein